MDKLKLAKTQVFEAVYEEYKLQIKAAREKYLATYPYWKD
jgi:hypothetical protein